MQPISLIQKGIAVKSVHSRHYLTTYKYNSHVHLVRAKIHVLTDNTINNQSEAEQMIKTHNRSHHCSNSVFDNQIHNSKKTELKLELQAGHSSQKKNTHKCKTKPKQTNPTLP